MLKSDVAVQNGLLFVITHVLRGELLASVYRWDENASSLGHREAQTQVRLMRMCTYFDKRMRVYVYENKCEWANEKLSAQSLLWTMVCYLRQDTCSSRCMHSLCLFFSLLISCEKLKIKVVVMNSRCPIHISSIENMFVKEYFTCQWLEVLIRAT